MSFSKVKRRLKIKRRIRKLVSGSSQRPRLSVYRSNREIYAQLIDDDKRTTLVSACSRDKEILNIKSNKVEKALEVGKILAKKAKEKGIDKVTFDRNGYLYHGRVKSLAQGARENGLLF